MSRIEFLSVQKIHIRRTLESGSRQWRWQLAGTVAVAVGSGGSGWQSAVAGKGRVGKVKG